MFILIISERYSLLWNKSHELFTKIATSVEKFELNGHIQDVGL